MKWNTNKKSFHSLRFLQCTLLASAITIMLASATSDSVFAEDNTLSVSHQDQSYDVKTSLTNGVVNSIELDPDFTSIILTVEAGAEDGSLTITLPRALIDARNGNGTSDEQFIVAVGSSEVEYSEDGTTDAERVLTIAVPAGTERIEIVGTQLVPEFPLAVLSIVVAIVLMTGIISHKMFRCNSLGGKVRG